jgi:hypothetical protein
MERALLLSAPSSKSNGAFCTARGMLFAMEARRLWHGCRDGRQVHRRMFRPAPAQSTALQAAQRKIAELERQLGRMSSENDFLNRAFKRVKEAPRTNLATGALRGSKAKHLHFYTSCSLETRAG